MKCSISLHLSLSPSLTPLFLNVKSVSWTGLRGKSLAKRLGFKDSRTHPLSAQSLCTAPHTPTLIHPHWCSDWTTHNTSHLTRLENALLATGLGSASLWHPCEGYTIHQHQDHSRWVVAMADQVKAWTVHWMLELLCPMRRWSQFRLSFATGCDFSRICG